MLYAARLYCTLNLETLLRNLPHYMVIEHNPWLSTWFDHSSFIKIPIEEFDLKTISFTYGDSHPTFSPWPRDDDWKEYRGSCLE